MRTFLQKWGVGSIIITLIVGEIAFFYPLQTRAKTNVDPAMLGGCGLVAYEIIAAAKLATAPSSTLVAGTGEPTLSERLSEYIEDTAGPLADTICSAFVKAAWTAAKASFLDQMVNDTVDWIQTAGEAGRDPLPRFVTNWGEFSQKAGEKALKDFGGELANEILPALCQPFGLQIKIGLAEIPKFSTKVVCTADDIWNNITNFWTTVTDPNLGWINYQKTWDPNNNYYGAIIITAEESIKREVEKATGVSFEALAGGGTLGVEACDGNNNGKVEEGYTEAKNGNTEVPNESYPQGWDYYSKNSAITQTIPFTESDGTANTKTIDSQRTEAVCKRAKVTITPGKMFGDSISNAMKVNQDLIIFADDVGAYAGAIMNALMNRAFKVPLQGLLGLMKQGAGAVNLPAASPADVAKLSELAQAATPANTCDVYPANSDDRRRCEALVGESEADFPLRWAGLLKKIRDFIPQQTDAVKAVQDILDLAKAGTFDWVQDIIACAGVETFTETTGDGTPVTRVRWNTNETTIKSLYGTNISLGAANYFAEEANVADKAFVSQQITGAAFVGLTGAPERERQKIKELIGDATELRINYKVGSTTVPVSTEWGGLYRLVFGAENLEDLTTTSTAYLSGLESRVNELADINRARSFQASYGTDATGEFSKAALQNSTYAQTLFYKNACQRIHVLDALDKILGAEYTTNQAITEYNNAKSCGASVDTDITTLNIFQNGVKTLRGHIETAGLDFLGSDFTKQNYTFNFYSPFQAFRRQESIIPQWIQEPEKILKTSVDHPTSYAIPFNDVREYVYAKRVRHKNTVSGIFEDANLLDIISIAESETWSIYDWPGFIKIQKLEDEPEVTVIPPDPTHSTLCASLDANCPSKTILTKDAATNLAADASEKRNAAQTHWQNAVNAKGSACIPTP